MTKHSRWASDAAIVTKTYRGPDRREEQIGDDEAVIRKIDFDAKGNPILHVRTDVPRRREGDHTINLLEALNAEALGLKIED